MPRYTDVLELQDKRDQVMLQIGKALFTLDNSRKIFRNYKDLPKVGVKFALVESITTSLQGVSPMGEEIYYNAIDDNYIQDTIFSYNHSFRITAASEDPESYLNELATHRHLEDFWFEFFSKADIGVISISDPTDTSVPTDNGGDWEERRSVTLIVNYVAKKSKIVNTLDSISYGFAVGGDPTRDDVEGEGVADGSV